LVEIDFKNFWTCIWAETDELNNTTSFLVWQLQLPSLEALAFALSMPPTRQAKVNALATKTPDRNSSILQKDRI
jgi:hypothetical protein